MGDERDFSFSLFCSQCLCRNHLLFESLRFIAIICVSGISPAAWRRLYHFLRLPLPLPVFASSRLSNNYFVLKEFRVFFMALLILFYTIARQSPIERRSVEREIAERFQGPSVRVRGNWPVGSFLSMWISARNDGRSQPEWRSISGRNEWDVSIKACLCISLKSKFRSNQVGSNISSQLSIIQWEQ